MLKQKQSMFWNPTNISNSVTVSDLLLLIYNFFFAYNFSGHWSKIAKQWKLQAKIPEYVKWLRMRRRFPKLSTFFIEHARLLECIPLNYFFLQVVMKSCLSKIRSELKVTRKIILCPAKNTPNFLSSHDGICRYFTFFLILFFLVPSLTVIEMHG